MSDILDRIDWDHYRRTSYALVKPEKDSTVRSSKIYHPPLPDSPSALHHKYAIKDNEIEFVKFCQMIDMLDRHDDHLIMKQRIKRLNGDAKQRGIDAFEW